MWARNLVPHMLLILSKAAKEKSPYVNEHTNKISNALRETANRESDLEHLQITKQASSNTKKRCAIADGTKPPWRG